MKLPEKLLTLRKRSGLSQEALAGLLVLLPPECLRSWREQLSQRKK